MTYLFQRTKTVDARKYKIKWKISFEGFFMLMFSILSFTESRITDPISTASLNTSSFITFTTTIVVNVHLPQLLCALSVQTEHTINDSKCTNN